MNQCYLSLGSNLRVPQRQLRLAVAQLRKLPHSSVIKVSSLYLSRPWGPVSQPNYCNIVLALITSLSPSALLRYCQLIENRQLRVRKKRWGPRTLDIDILLYGNYAIHQHDLIIPHPRMTERDFILVPLLEIAPDIYLPSGRKLAECCPSDQFILVQKK